MSRGAALTGALLATLATPATWPLALAGFLLRGGLLLVILPVVVLPTPVGLGNLLAPTLMTVVLGGISAEVAVLVGSVVLAIVAWIGVGGLIAATLEAEAARIVGHDEDLAGFRPADGIAGPRRGIAARILVARVVAHGLTGATLVWGAVRLVALTYRELTSPFDVATPIALRVLRAAPEVFVLIVVAWAFGEIVGGIAARRIALDGAGVGRALRDAATTVARHPLSVLLGFWVPAATLAGVVIPSIVAGSTAWGIVRVAMRSSSDTLVTTVSVVLFVAIWMLGLVLIAVTCAWRAAVWSVADRQLREPRSDPSLGRSG
jgi:hypothetical protein